MSEYKKLAVSPPEAVSKISELFEQLKSGIDVISNTAKTSVELAKLQASSANIALMALSASLDQIIDEIEKLKGGKLSGIIATPYAPGIKAGYDRHTDTMTLTAVSALEQIQEAFDDEADPLAPDKVNKYGGLTIVGSAPGVEEFFKILESIGKFFSLQELIDLAEQIKERWEEKEVVVKLPKGLAFIGIAPFPKYAALLSEVQSFIEGIKSGIVSVRGSMDDTIEFIEKKLAEAEKIANKMVEFLDEFVFEISEAGVYYKTFKDQKADEIKEELTKGAPASWKKSKYSAVLGIYGGPSTAGLIFDLLALD